MGNLEFRELKRGDEEGLSRVIAEVLHADQDTDYWRWKYFQNPAGEHMVTVALEAGRIVGVQGYLPGRLKCGSRVILSAQNTDMAVQAKYRTGGTFISVHEKAMEKGPRKRGALCYGFPNRTAYRLAPCLEYTGVCPIFNLTKVLNPVPYIRRKVGRWFPGFLARCFKGIAARGYGRKMAIGSGSGIHAVTRFDRKFDEFWHTESSHYPIAVVRDSAYLNWRYVDGPSSYKIFCIKQGEAVKGFVVLKCLDDDTLRRGKIVDILVERDNHAIADRLIDTSIGYFANEGVDVVTTWMFEQWPVFRVFQQKGFGKRKAPHYLVVNSKYVDIPGEVFQDPVNWYVTMGDSDYC